jgi:PhnB protein
MERQGFTDEFKREVSRGGATIRGCAVSLYVDTIAEAERILATLSGNGTVQMPLGTAFWAARFGMCIDRFGVPWMINYEANKEGQ